MSRVAILLALYNGARHLGAQLDSFANQIGVDWSLLVSDDGSRDKGPQMVRDFAKGSAVTLIDGPRRGYAANFLHLIAAVGPDAPAVALSDQDDVWLPQKLARGLAAMEGKPGPVLYCARTRVVGPELQERGLSPVWPRPFGFANALVQNVAAGNTIMLNRAALDLAQEAIRRMQGAASGDIVVHDWWLYQLVSGSGGLVVHDPVPVLLYRQHAGNLIGDNRGVVAKLRRLGMVLSGSFQDWNGRNIKAMQAAGDLLTPDARAVLARFAALRQGNVLDRLLGLGRSGIYRQTVTGQATLWFSALIGRI